MTNNMIEYDGPERRRKLLSEEQIEEIADRAADKAVDKLKREAVNEVGVWTIHKIKWIFTIATLFVFVWLVKNGYIKP